MGEVLRVGTRGSRLALAQVEILRGLFLALGVKVEPVVIRTSGDRGDRDRLGAFVGDIQQAVLRGEIDVALHCLKDLPTTPVEGLSIAAYLEREDPSEALLSRIGSLNELPPGAVIGTGSIRRTTQLSELRPDLRFRPLVGNVDTRIERLRSGEYDAIVLAVAGLRRLGFWSQWPFDDVRVDILPLNLLVPAPGQGVLALETRDDFDRRSIVAQLNHAETEAFARAERAFLATFGGGCSVPVGAYASFAGAAKISLLGLIGPMKVSVEGGFDEPEALGRAAAGALLARGARLP